MGQVIAYRRDREFLPAALEVLETPSSPKRRALLFTLCGFVACALAWSVFGRVDIEAVAKGKVEPEGRVKVIEPFEPGRVLAVLVTDGAHVRKGQPLVAFDPTEMVADETAARQALAVDLADAARYSAAVSPAALRDPGGVQVAVAWDDLVPGELRAREAAALSADMVQLGRTLRNADMQAAEKRATIKRLDSSVDADARLVATLQERVDMRQILVAHDNGTKANLIDALQDLEKAQAALVADRGARGEALAAIDTLASDRARAEGQFVADNTNKLGGAANRAAQDRQALAKAVARSGRTTLTAPVDGVVQKLAVTTVGQVVTTGQELMTVVPTGGALSIEAFIDNADIGFVHPGQAVVVKLDAFPFTRYGTLDGTVVSVATDALDEGEARRLQANATSLVNSAGMAGAADGQGQRFVFPVRVALKQAVFRAGDTDIPLSPGMSVTAEIKTDRQRIIDYLLSPLKQTVSEAMHER